MATDEEIFASALTDEPTAPPAPEPEPAPVAQDAEPEPTGQARDAHGRFAPKAAEEPAPEPAAPAAPAAQPQAEHGAVPPGRFREVSERARRAEEANAQLQAQLAQFLAAQRAPQPAQPAQQPADPFVRLMEAPGEVISEHARELLSPVQQEVGRLREFYSQREAVREHGADTVRAAFDAVDQAAKAGDPDAIALVQRVRNPANLDPYGELVQGHKRMQAVQRVGNDPDAWFQSTLEERVKSDPAFAASLLEKIRGQAAPAATNAARPSSPPVVQLPPSLSRVASAAPAGGEDMGASDADMFRYALR